MSASPARRDVAAAQDGGRRQRARPGPGCPAREWGSPAAGPPVSHVLSSLPSRVSAKWRLRETVPFWVLSSLPPENRRSPSRANNCELAAELGPEPAVGDRDLGGAGFRSRGRRCRLVPGARLRPRTCGACGSRRRRPLCASGADVSRAPVPRAGLRRAQECVHAAASQVLEKDSSACLGRTQAITASSGSFLRRRCGVGPFPTASCTRITAPRGKDTPLGTRPQLRSLTNHRTQVSPRGRGFLLC